MFRIFTAAEQALVLTADTDSSHPNPLRAAVPNAGRWKPALPRAVPNFRLRTTAPFTSQR